MKIAAHSEPMIRTNIYWPIAVRDSAKVLAGDDDRNVSNLLVRLVRRAAREAERRNDGRRRRR